MTFGRQALGARGERLAARWYVEHGYEILDRNWRCSQGELDLVLARDRQVVFCEVKTRTSDAFGSPAEAVTPAKQHRLRRLAAAWIEATSERPVRVRFDVAAVTGNRVEVIEAAF
jgi:putative endonuclease